jgi:mRNA interferase HicA
LFILESCDEQTVPALARATGAVFKTGKGSHLKVYLKDRQSVLPMHNAELKKGLVEAIKKQLGLK